jgi:hypothetical protein
MKTQGTPKQSAGQPKNAWPVLPLCLGIMTAISSPAYAENTPSHSSETPEIFKLVVASVKLFRLLFYSNGLAPVAG